MIFDVPGHVDMIRNGLRKHPPISSIPPRFYVKTMTRRMSRGIYLVESKRKKPHKPGYAVQRKRGVMAEPDIRIVFDRIWEEKTKEFLIAEDGGKYPNEIVISEEDACAEGGYSPAQYEELFMDINPKWDGWARWAFEFHVIKMEKEIL